MSNGIRLTPYFEQLEPSATLHINERVKRLWQEGRTVYHLGFGESRFPVHPLLTAALARHANAKSYLPAAGLWELREAVAAWYSGHLAMPVKPSQVVIGPGSKALIYAAQMALSAPLYLPAPSWVSYAPQAQMLGKTVHWVEGSPDNHYALDLKRLEALLAQDASEQKLLIINSPNNPTGGVMDQPLLEQLASLCRQFNVLVISDEIYFRVMHPGETHHSIAHEYPEGSLILGGLSKHLSLGGWRLGVALLPDTESGQKLGDAMAAIASETWSAVAAPLQHAACIAYSGNEQIERYVDRCTRLHATRTGFLYQRLRQMGIDSTPPRGAFYLTVSFDRWAARLHQQGITTSTALADVLLDRYAIAALPAEPFGLPASSLSLRLAASYLDMESDQDAQRLLDLAQSGIDDDTLMSRQHHPNLHACLDALGRFLGDHKIGNAQEQEPAGSGRTT